MDCKPNILEKHSPSQVTVRVTALAIQFDKTLKRQKENALQKHVP